jgi:hypothetical protein
MKDNSGISLSEVEFRARPFFTNDDSILLSDINHSKFKGNHFNFNFDFNS